ncbi:MULTISPECIES: TetR/AcrR family transcriptional regulator [unclassified Xanthobacter]|uniref:TetR/AcrR family transcriptional regulator n=1 Tax=unclassified Xanthobacter TaxID=2623496 RepID=UPI001F1D8B3A|nr:MULTISPECIES: TetR/AcrR family transcriptional regulator [unclassified Xanthobacter]
MDENQNPSPRARRKEDARERILQAARRIVLDEGFAALTMRRIAQQAGYSPAALYLHFECREAIARELGEAGMRSLHARLSEAGCEADPLARLRALSRAYVQFAREEPETYRLIFMEPGFAASALGGKDETGAAAFALLAGVFAELAAARRLRAGAQPESLATGLWVLLHGLASLKITCSAFLSAPEEELLAGMLDNLLHGVLRAAPES